MSKLRTFFVYTLWLWLLVVLVWVMNSVDPVSAGPGGILFVFILIYLIVASVRFTTLHWGVRVVSERVAKAGGRVTTRTYRIGVHKAYYIASVVAFGPILLLALNSVRQLRPTDVFLVGAFLALAIFYILKRE